MKDPDVRFNQLIAALKEHHYRLTPQRLDLLRLIAVSEGHPNASQLFARIRSQHPTMSYATVYKTLALLKELNQVYEIDSRSDSHYDGNRPEPHPHLICVKCNGIVDAEVSLNAVSLRKLEVASGYKILRQKITLLGLCSNCKEDE